MTDLVVRRLQIDLATPFPGRWNGGDAFRSAFFNALSMSFPVGEQYFMDSVRNGLKTLPTAEQKKYVVRPVKNITALEENLPGLVGQRTIVRWAFEEDTNVGDIKRFSLPKGGYAVVQLTADLKEGLASIDEVKKSVQKIIINNKKAALINKQFKDKTTLDALVADDTFTIENASAINQKNPTLVGAGNEPYVVGAAFALEEGQISDFIKGENGVFKVILLKKNIVDDLEDYTPFINKMMLNVSSRLTESVFKALESVAKIDDNRALYY